MARRLCVALVALGIGWSVQAQQWDSVVGAVAEVGSPTPHWFTVRSRQTGFLIDGDSGQVQGTLTLSGFSPALQPHLSKGLIYSYGSFYSRGFYGDRTDVVLMFDAKTAAPVAEVAIPAKSAGIGHSGMIGLIDDRFIGVWNITPAMSVSIVDARARKFVGEISTPGCAAVYPIGRGFLMPCGDGALQYVALRANGTEARRVRGEPFFSVENDPVYDYAVPTADGWLFVSVDGQVFEATLQDGNVIVSEPWSIRSTDEREADWRIGGYQPFAYNAATGLLVTLMHEGGGQETFEDPGTEVWAFNIRTQRRGYRLALDEPAVSVQLTADPEPLLMISTEASSKVLIHDARSSRLLRTVDEIGAGLIQNL
jgi:methylamine dehydrogenase heavy chain